MSREVVDLRETYNRIARDWARDHQDDTWWVDGTNRFLDHLKPGAKILDVGCGTGWKSKYFLERGFRVTGFDLSEGMIEVARQQAPEADFYVLDMANIDELDGQFDAVFAQAVLLHVPKSETQECVRGLTRKLTPNGYFYVAVKGIRPGQAEEEVKVENDYGYEYQRFFSYYTRAEVEDIFGGAGLSTIWSHVEQFKKTDWIQVIGHQALKEDI